MCGDLHDCSFALKGPETVVVKDAVKTDTTNESMANEILNAILNST